jgi:hypothetical protein
MSDPKKLSQKVPFWADGEALTGTVFFLTGTIVCWQGLLRLHGLWIEFQPLLPLTLPSNVSNIIAKSFPIILNTLISTISSFCAILMGSVWAFSGLVDVFHSRRSKIVAGNFDQPEWVAESLISAQPLYGRSFSLSDRVLTFFVPQIRYISPVRYQIFHEALRSIWKTLFLALLLTIAVHFVYALPSLLNKYLSIRINYSGPYPTSLFCLLGLVVAVDILIAVSLVPFKRSAYSHRTQTLYFTAYGVPNLLLALLEESLKLLTLKGFPVGRPTRLQQDSVGMARGTLVENFPRIVRARSIVAGYLCLGLVIILIIVGFINLIRFQHPVSAYGELTDFLSQHSLEYVFQIMFALGLIVSGTYFASWAGKLLNIRNFRSALVFCAIKAHVPSEEVSKVTQPKKFREQMSTWKVLDKVDDLFVAWAQDPSGLKIFSLEIFWAEIISESTGGLEPRFVTNLNRSESLDRQIPPILNIPFIVNFERVPTESPQEITVDSNTN